MSPISDSSFMTATMKAKAAALHALRVIRAVRHDAVRPPYTAPGHYYSPLTSSEDIERAVTTRQPPAGVDLRSAGQLALAAELDLIPPDEGRWVDGTACSVRPTPQYCGR